MTLRDFNKRLDALEEALSANRGCSTCSGTGIDRIAAVPDEDSTWPAHLPCPECGRMSFRQHVVVGVSQADLDAMFAPAAPRDVAPYLVEIR